jgi:2-hydroxy-3-keto-5-methylthiopentenyl-1-phosphate phosphatase
MPPLTKPKRMVFCDFDGTITVQETFVGMLKKFSTKRFDEIEQYVRARKMTLPEGVRTLVESIPSKRYPEILDDIRNKEIRTGLPELLDFLHKEEIPFVIISAGLLGVVKKRLESFAHRIHAIYAADVDTTGKFLKLISDFENGTMLVAKSKVMAKYDFDQSVAIGDGVSDRGMALASSIVFARGWLTQHLEAKGKTFNSWDNFYDIRDCLKKCWQRPAR